MTRIIFFTISTLFLFSIQAICQNEKLEVEGAIKIGNSSNSSPEPGTIRWTGSDFLGWNGSNWVSLTNRTTYAGEVTDVDDNVYQTVMIGNAEWMAQNLRTTRYRDSTAIDHKMTDNDWKTASTGAWCWYNNDSTNYEIPHGKLYNWFAVDDPAGLCPSGWHVPTNDDWSDLLDYLGGSSLAGGPMKVTSLNYWGAPNTGATNGSGFSGLGSGLREDLGAFDYYLVNGAWHTEDEFNPGNLLIRFAAFDDIDLDGSVNDKKYGLSVRCVKD